MLTFFFLSHTESLEYDRDPRGRPPVESRRVFAATLRWLATGGAFNVVADDFGIAKSTIQKHVHRVITALVEVFVPLQIKFPISAELEQTMFDFEQKSGLPNVAGAVDGTIIEIRKPSGDYGDRYWCYKNKVAVLFLAVVDAVGRFTFVDAGRPSSIGDARAWSNSELAMLLQARNALPPQYDKVFSNGVTLQPYLLADDAFPLTRYLQKCYDGVVESNSWESKYNRAVIEGRRCVEQAFGRFKGRWRLLLTRSNVYDPQFMADVITACCALHNYCESLRLTAIFGPVEEVPEAFGEDMAEIVAGSSSSAPGSTVRASLRDYLAGTLHIVDG
jgi:hypothetical protein